MLEEAEKVEHLVAQSRKETGAGLAARQREAIEEFAVTDRSERKRCSDNREDEQE
jgi:hypothetical protein